MTQIYNMSNCILLCFLFLIVQIHSFSTIDSQQSRLIHYLSNGGTTRLYDSQQQPSSSVRFLGRGANAIVRPGVVLLAPAEEFHHFLREAAVFIYAMGLDEHDVYVIRGVIIDHPTPFTIGEMMDQQEDPGTSNGIMKNLLYRGGDLGGESAFMLHSDDDLAQVADIEMIGTSGVYEGGFERALENGESLDPSKAKFFFSYMEFTEQELENMLEDPQEDGDAWVSVEVAPEIVLSSDYDRGDAWARLRNAVRSS